jgi:hypothetical protein
MKKHPSFPLVLIGALAAGPTTAAPLAPGSAIGASPSVAGSPVFAPTLLAQAPKKKVPSSKEALFGDDGDDGFGPAKGAAEKPSGPRPAASQKDELFGAGEADAAPRTAAGSAPEKAAAPVLGLKGYLQAELARTVSEPAHWSKLRIRADLQKSGRISERIKYRLGLRLDADAAYEQSDFYPREVRDDERLDAQLRENFLDISAGGGLDLRIGRQHVVWGEMVGLYFADVVSARDFREFILPDFESQRIPQWAARAEYFGDQFHAELLWIPVPSYDRIGKPGAEFFPAQPVPAGSTYLGETKPDRDSSNTNYGARFSGLFAGWDLSAFGYRSVDVAQTFTRSFVAPSVSPTLVAYRARHDRISQFGGTLSKDFGSVVLKGEAVRTKGRSFAVVNPADPDGVAPSDTIDWAVGLDFNPFADVRFNIQAFQRIFSDYDPLMLTEEKESGYSVYLTNKFSDRLEAQLLWIASLDRDDWLARPKLIWNPVRNWRLQAGADIFRGPAFGLFGQFAARDRGYFEARYSF